VAWIIGGPLTELTNHESMSFSFFMTFKTGSSRIANSILRLVVAPEPLKSPTPCFAIMSRVFDHDVHSSALSFENNSILLLRLTQFVHDHRTLGEVAGCVAIHSLLVREDMVHSLLALRDRSTRQYDAGPHVNPTSKVVRVLYGFSREEKAG
jgi:hypothetical protein